MRQILILLALLAITACATPEQRLKDKLVQAGIDEPVAGCMAERMTDRLSLYQLDKLRRLGKVRDPDTGRVDYRELGRKLKGLDDPEIVEVTVSSGLICAALY